MPTMLVDGVSISAKANGFEEGAVLDHEEASK
jgi:hypothetical protein